MYRGFVAYSAPILTTFVPTLFMNRVAEHLREPANNKGKAKEERGKGRRLRNEGRKGQRKARSGKVNVVRQMWKVEASNCKWGFMIMTNV